MRPISRYRQTAINEINQATGARARGFSLIELIVAVAILGILVAVAYPSYRDSVTKSRRADAKAALLELGQFMERTFVENKTYQPGGATPALPFNEAPKDAGTKFYDLTLENMSATTFRLKATLKASFDDRCGALTFDNRGQKDVVGADAGVTAANCW